MEQLMPKGESSLKGLMMNYPLERVKEQVDRKDFQAADFNV